MGVAHATFSIISNPTEADIRGSRPVGPQCESGMARNPSLCRYRGASCTGVQKREAAGAVSRSESGCGSETLIRPHQLFFMFKTEALLEEALHLIAPGRARAQRAACGYALKGMRAAPG